MEPHPHVPAGQTLYAELDLLLAEGEVDYPAAVLAAEDDGMDDVVEALDAQILAGLVSP
jgi:hypothetical protein